MGMHHAQAKVLSVILQTRFLSMTCAGLLFCERSASDACIAYGRSRKHCLQVCTWSERYTVVAGAAKMHVAHQAVAKREEGRV